MFPLQLCLSHMSPGVLGLCDLYTLISSEWFVRHSLLHMLLQPGVSILYPCFPIGHSGNSNFGFCNKFLFLGAGYQPTTKPPILRTRGCSSSGLATLRDQSGMVRPVRDQSPHWYSSQGTLNTALIFLEIFLIEHCTVLVEPPLKSSVSLFA